MEEGVPGALAVDPHRLGSEHVLDDVGGSAGEAQRREQAERDRVAVPQLVAGAGLERVRERVAEIQDRPPPLTLVRVGENDRGLERGAGADQLLVRQRPELLPGEQARLHDLGHPGPAFLGRKRGQVRRVDEHVLRKVERAREVLALVGVDPRLSADRRIDHADERRRDGDPANAAQMRRRHEAGDVRRRSAAEADDPPVPTDRELAPHARDDGQRLRVLAARNEMCGDGFAKPRLVELQDALVRNERRLDRNVARERDPERRQDDGRGVVPLGLRNRLVDGQTLVVQRSELTPIPGQRPSRSADALPGGLLVHLDPDDERRARQPLPRGLRQDRSAAQRDDRRWAGQRLRDDLLLDPSKLGLAALEELADRAEAFLDLLVGVDERTVREAARARGRASSSPRP